MLHHYDLCVLKHSFSVFSCIFVYFPHSRSKMTALQRNMCCPVLFCAALLIFAQDLKSKMPSSSLDYKLHVLEQLSDVTGRARDIVLQQFLTSRIFLKCVQSMNPFQAFWTPFDFGDSASIHANIQKHTSLPSCLKKPGVFVPICLEWLKEARCFWLFLYVFIIRAMMP